MIKVHVPLPQNPYDIIIERNLLKHINKYIDISRQIVIITDENIPKQYLNQILAQIPNSLVLEVPQGESSKSLEMAKILSYRMLDNHITRSAIIIALGGGVIGDLAGFVASIYMRGIDYIQIPTTLLSQIDSSVGGKVGVNTPQMKNALGAFKQPITVLIDPNTLQTLPKKQINNGIAEMIKYGIIASKSLFYAVKENNIMDDIIPYIHECIAIKRDIVLQDEKDYGVRQILNYGHTIGHALEQYSKYDLLHGEAISIGMCMMSIGTSFEQELKDILSKYNLPTTYEYDKTAVYEIILTDKKASDTHLNIILADEVGKGYIKRISIEEIKSKL